VRARARRVLGHAVEEHGVPEVTHGASRPRREADTCGVRVRVRVRVRV
jgi:hypothetical protein